MTHMSPRPDNEGQPYLDPKLYEAPSEKQPHAETYSVKKREPVEDPISIRKAAEIVRELKEKIRKTKEDKK